MTLQELALRILDLPEELQQKKAYFSMGTEEPSDTWEIDNLERIPMEGEEGYQSYPEDIITLETDLEHGDFYLTP